MPITAAGYLRLDTATWRQIVSQTAHPITDLINH
jgi:hypothetical protein